MRQFSRFAVAALLVALAVLTLGCKSSQCTGNWEIIDEGACGSECEQQCDEQDQYVLCWMSPDCKEICNCVGYPVKDALTGELIGDAGTGPDLRKPMDLGLVAALYR